MALEYLLTDSLASSLALWKLLKNTCCLLVDAPNLSNVVPHFFAALSNYPIAWDAFSQLSNLSKSKLFINYWASLLPDLAEALIFYIVLFNLSASLSSALNLIRSSLLPNFDNF
jgi:hypothetical protein